MSSINTVHDDEAVTIVSVPHAARGGRGITAIQIAATDRPLWGGDSDLEASAGGRRR